MESFTQAGTILGTAGYLSPEQARGERAGAASDRYALAVVAWELLAGRRPFQADSPTAEAAAHVTAPIPSLARGEPAVPATVDPVFERALAKDPASAIATAAEFVGELRRALHDDAGDTWIERPAPATAATHVVARRRRSRWWIPALVALLVAAGILAAVLYSRGGDNATTTQAGPRTIVKTVTSQGTTVHQTVTATAAARLDDDTVHDGLERCERLGAERRGLREDAGGRPRGGVAAARAGGGEAVRHGQHDRGVRRLQPRVHPLQARQCTDVVTLLDRSRVDPGARKEIDRLRKAAEKRCESTQAERRTARRSTACSRRT